MSVGDLVEHEHCLVMRFDRLEILIVQAQGFNGVLESLDFADCQVHFRHLVCGDIRSDPGTRDFAGIRAVLLQAGIRERIKIRGGEVGLLFDQPGGQIVGGRTFNLFIALSWYLAFDHAVL